MARVLDPGEDMPVNDPWPFAEKFGVTRATATRIVYNHTWIENED